MLACEYHRIIPTHLVLVVFIGILINRGSCCCASVVQHGVYSILVQVLLVVLFIHNGCMRVLALLENQHTAFIAVSSTSNVERT